MGPKAKPNADIKRHRHGTRLTSPLPSGSGPRPPVRSGSGSILSRKTFIFQLSWLWLVHLKSTCGTGADARGPLYAGAEYRIVNYLQWQHLLDFMRYGTPTSYDERPIFASARRAFSRAATCLHRRLRHPRPAHRTGHGAARHRAPHRTVPTCTLRVWRCGTCAHNLIRRGGEAK